MKVRVGMGLTVRMIRRDKTKALFIQRKISGKSDLLSNDLKTCDGRWIHLQLLL